jgi:protein O-GlcNAc transferase
LRAGPFRDTAVRRDFQRCFADQGIEADRLELGGPMPMVDYLAAYNQVDIGLDPIPYNGGTTTCEALLMGVPVITLAGKSLFARMGASILTSLGVPELIAQSPEEYVILVEQWANDLARLAELRAGLRSRFLASSLGDGPGLARKIENAFRTIVTDY